MKIGVALAGGGIRGIAHAGVLKALEENQISVDVIGGTSSGSLVASLYAMGYSPYYIYVLFKRYAKELVTIDTNPIITGVSNFMRNKKVQLYGFNTGEGLEKAYHDLALRKGIRTCKDIPLPLVIPSVDVEKAQKYIFTNQIPVGEENNSSYITDIPIGTAVRASSSFPGVFCPCVFRKHRFLDGGILDNIPVLEVKKQGVDKVLAVNFKADDIDETSNVMDITMRTIDIMGNKISEESLASSDYVLTVQTDKTGLLDVEKLDSCYQYGYYSAKEQMKEIKKALAEERT